MNNDEFVIEPQQTNLLEIELLGSFAGIGSDNIHVDTTAGWEAQPALVAKLGHLYVYSDYAEKDGVDIPAVKVGDGVSLVVDLPFITVDLTDIETALSAIQSALEDKVDKVEGKGLSTNDFTDALKDKLDGIESGAQVNTVTGVKGSAEAEYRTGNIDITKANIGLGNVNNTSDADKPISTAVQTALNNKVDKETGKGLSTNDFTDALKTKLDGIETGAEANVQADWNQTDTNADDYIKNKPTVPTATSQLTNDSGFITASQAPVQGVKGDAETDYRTGNVNITKTNIGLGNVTNDAQVKRTEMGVAEGVATLDSAGKVPAAQLPSYVDDVLEYASVSDFPVTGESGKIYIALDTNKTYRWGGSSYVEISESLALGETSSTAYRGDRGKIAYDHSQTTSGNPHNVTKSDVGLGNVDNTSDANKPISTATQTALNAKANESDLTAHTGDNVIHVTAQDKSTWNGKQDALTFDNTPTESSTNPVTSGGLYSLLNPVASEATGQSILTTETAMNTSMNTLLSRLVDAHPTAEAGDLIVQDLVQGNILLAEIASNIAESGVF